MTATHTFTVRHSFNEEEVVISLNGVQIASLNHDAIGWDGMDAATQLMEKIAEKIGATIVHVEGDGDEE